MTPADRSIFDLFGPEPPQFLPHVTPAIQACKQWREYSQHCAAVCRQENDPALFSCYLAGAAAFTIMESMTWLDSGSWWAMYWSIDAVAKERIDAHLGSGWRSYNALDRWIGLEEVLIPRGLEDDAKADLDNMLRREATRHITRIVFG